MQLADLVKKLEDPTSSEHAAVLEHVKSLIALSRSEMGKNYSRWDENDDIFRSKRKEDKEDRAAEGRGQPKKMIVALTFSQVMTFVSFAVMTLTQNRRFFELEPVGTEDNPLRETIELVLERDVRRNKWTAFLIQFFLDAGRFGIGAYEVCYVEEFKNLRIPQTRVEEGALGEEIETSTTDFQQIPMFIGNKIYSVSPYRFFPDTRLPLVRYQEGEFCGSEDMFSVSSLRGNKGLINTDKIPKMTEEQFNERRSISRIGNIELTSDKTKKGFGTSGTEGTGECGDGYAKSGSVIVTKIVVDIIPADFVVGPDGQKLGDETFPVRYLVWYANDGVIIRFEEAYYLHGMFPYGMGQFLPDQHQSVNESLADMCEQITNLITWKMNAHVASQRNSVQSKWIVDPSGIDVKNLESNNPYIFLKPAVSMNGVDRYIKQFKTEDTTQNVMADTTALKELNESITGMSSQMQGQYSQGRRSATQDRVVAQGAASRAKTTLMGIWDLAFEPLGRQLIANNRQEMEPEVFAKILGSSPLPMNPETLMPFTVEELYAVFKADPASIAMSEDFFVFDGTLPSEKAFLAQSLQEILGMMLTNPQVAMALGYGPEQFKSLLNDVYNLRGVTPARLPAPSGPTTPMPPQVVPMTPPEEPAVSNG